MNLKLTKEINEILAYSKEEAMRTGCFEITNDHLILGILRHHNNLATGLLAELRISVPYLKLKISDKIDKGVSIPYPEIDKVTFSQGVQMSLKIMFMESGLPMTTPPTALHLLLAILKINDSVFSHLMIDMGLPYATLKSKIEPEDPITPESDEADNNSDDSAGSADDDDGMSKANAKRPIRKAKETGSSLESYGYDLTKAAAEDRLDPVVGREKEIERLAQILGRRKKNNPVLIGEPGVGKSAIAEGLAIRIAQRNVSRALLDKKIISLDIGSIVAGTKFRGQFEERIKSILKELKEQPDTILFIDEMHTLVGAGGAIGSLDAANMLKPALSRGELQCIGATTLDEFREIIEKDGALERRFQKIMVEPTTFDETIKILENIKSKYEKHHNVRYTPEALRACITLSTRYISDRCLPDKAIDVLDEAGSKAHLKNMRIPKKILTLEKEVDGHKASKIKAIDAKNFEQAEHYRFLEKEAIQRLSTEMKKMDAKMAKSPETVTEESISEVMSMMTGIPLNKIAMSEGNKLLSMGATLREKIIGQDEAVDKVVRAIQRNRAGLKDPNKPIGTFLFLGPTGVGKTHLAKMLANYMFDSADSLIRIDMSEYMEKFAVSRLIGAPPGYVGYEEGGQLSERVRRKPYCVVLLDEIEKAHPDIFNLLLQVLDEGRLTDSNGRNIDFRNTVLIMTSNIGSRELKDFGKGIGYATSTKADSTTQNKTIIDKAIGKTFTPEFLNRLDEQIYFNSLTKSDISKIVDIELCDLYRRVTESGYKLTISASAKKFICDVAYDPRYGARPLKRAIQHYIEDPVAEAIISGTHTNRTLSVVLNSGKDKLVVR